MDKTQRRIALILIPILCLAAGGAPAALPVDEETMAQFERIHESLANEQFKMEQTTSELAAEHEQVARRFAPIEAELDFLADQHRRVVALPEADRADAVRAIEERHIEAKSRYIELIAQQRTIDVELFRSYIGSGGAILRDLERYTKAMEDAGTNAVATPDGVEPIRAMQFGTARALAAIEDWGELTREDPRFRALWETARMLGKAQKALQEITGTGATAHAVKSQIFNVRSLLDQAVIALKILETEGDLIQVVTQNLVFRLLSQRMPGFGGTELPAIDFEDRLGRIRKAGFEEPSEEHLASKDSMFAGFDDCADMGICD